MTCDTELCVLVDNGSVRDHAALFTRKLANDLSRSCGQKVVAVSLAHSDRIPVEKLNGVPVPLLEPFLDGLRSHPSLLRLRVIPLLMVSEGVIYRKIAAAVDRYARARSEVCVSLAPALVDPSEQDEGSIPDLMARGIVETLQEHKLRRAEIIVVDHGSPVQAVAELRNWVASAVDQRLPAGWADRVVAASMERRDGPAYAFAEPLLKTALEDAALRGVHELVVAKLFLQPGKHSGRRGDIDGIVGQVLEQYPALTVHQPRQLFRQKDLITLLQRRLIRLAPG